MIIEVGSRNFNLPLLKLGQFFSELGTIDWELEKLDLENINIVSPARGTFITLKSIPVCFSGFCKSPIPALKVNSRSTH